MTIRHFKTISRIARKNHQCFHCYWLIQKGELYNVSCHADGSKVYDLKTHQQCDSLHDYMVKKGQIEVDPYDGYGPMYDYMFDSGENFMAWTNEFKDEFPDAILHLRLSYKYANRDEDNI